MPAIVWHIGNKHAVAHECPARICTCWICGSLSNQFLWLSTVCGGRKSDCRKIKFKLLRLPVTWLHTKSKTGRSVQLLWRHFVIRLVEDVYHVKAVLSGIIHYITILWELHILQLYVKGQGHKTCWFLWANELEFRGVVFNSLWMLLLSCKWWSSTSLCCCVQ